MDGVEDILVIFCTKITATLLSVYRELLEVKNSLQQLANRVEVLENKPICLSNVFL